jgi:hypothetical protein
MTKSQSDHPGLRACPQCNQEFICGLEAGLNSCWCGDLPRIMPVVADGPGCLCRDCLTQAIEERLQGAQDVERR